MFMDSNRNYLNPGMLWDNLTIVPAGCTNELLHKIEKNDLRNFDVIIIHVGVNDIDNHDGKSVAKRLIDITSRIKASAPGIHIILSEVTPRQLRKDNEVLICNEELKVLQNTDNITLARHSNLRDSEWSYHKKKDDKHFTEEAIARLAGNLKDAFRRAIGAKRRMSAGRHNDNWSGYHGSRNGEGRNKDKQSQLMNKRFSLKDLLKILR